MDEEVNGQVKIDSGGRYIPLALNTPHLNMSFSFLL